MQFAAFLASALALANSALAAPTNQATCQQKSQQTGSGAYAAIQSFCSPTDITANSQYAIRGTHGGVMGKGMTSHVFIAPSGSCPSNSNWVPQKYCFSQFYEVCAKGDRYGHGEMGYGVNNCQKFNIQP